jgi:hypothetical protein
MLADRHKRIEALEAEVGRLRPPRFVAQVEASREDEICSSWPGKAKPPGPARPGGFGLCTN